MREMKKSAKFWAPHPSGHNFCMNCVCPPRKTGGRAGGRERGEGVRYTFIKIWMKLSLFIKNHIHQKPHSSKNTFIKNFHPKYTFIPSTLSSQVHFHPIPQTPTPHT